MESINVLQMKSATLRHDTYRLLNDVGTKKTDPGSWINEGLRDKIDILFNSIDREIKRMEEEDCVQMWGRHYPKP